MINFFKSGGTFTNIDITKIEGYSSDEDTRNDIAWSTEKVDAIIKDFQDGNIELGRIKNSPFLQNNIDIRKPNITYQYTQDEINELRKCSLDPVYFADKYCKLFTENGFQHIKVRDYQQGLLEGMKEHNKCIIMCSRQLGKCFFGDSKIKVRNKKTGEVIEIQADTFFEKIKKYKNDIDLSILSSCVLDNKNFKFIESYDIDDWEVETDTGWEDISKIHKTIPYDVWNIETEDFYLECADEHILFDENMNEVYVKDIREGDYIQTKNGVQKVISIGIEDREKENMYDLELPEGSNHRYYTNGILSHNTTTSAIFILWYVLFNKEKNVLMLGDILDTTIEIIDKVKQILNGLPFFMKPGMVINNVKSMKFDNGCRIIGRSTTKKSAIGLTINMLYMDEFAHISANFIDNFWRSTYPTISSMKDSRVIITSTPNGMNKFQSIWATAIDSLEGDGKSEFYPLRADWWQVPGRDEKWKQTTIAELGSIEDFNQEYGLQFFKGDNLLLNSSDVKKLFNIKTRYISRDIDVLHMEKTYYKDQHKFKTMADFSENMKWHPNFLTNTFKKYMVDLKSDKHYYILGIDTAKGVGKDYHVINIFKIAPMPLNRMLMNRNNISEEIDIFSLIQVGLFRSNAINIETFSDVVNNIVFKFFNPEYVRIGLELNNQGVLVRDKLERHQEYWDGLLLYSKRNESNDSWEPGTDLTSNKMKVNYCENFQQLISIDRIITTDDLTFNELSNFGSNEGRTVYRCQTGHDDLAMSSIHASAFMQSPQYDEICWDLFDEIDDKDYLNHLQTDVIDYNINRLGEDAPFRPEDLIEIN